MRSDKRLTIVLFSLLLLTIVYSVNTLYGQDKQEPRPPKQGVAPPSEQEVSNFRSQFPVADYHAPEPSEAEKRVRRKAKNKRHDKSGLVSREPAAGVSETSLYLEGALDFPAVPVNDSDVIVMGEVLDAQAHLSDDKTNVYSEFIVSVTEVLKNGGPVPLKAGETVAAERVGGFVQYPNGQKELYRIVGFGMPRVGRRYVLFLNAIAGAEDFRILTAYELRGQKVYPLDESKQFYAYAGHDEASFINSLRDALGQPQPPGN